MQTNDHPHDSIPAFMLGTLDIDEALLVSAHVLECPGCRAEAEAFQVVLSALPYVVAPHQPPAHVKHQLLARIAAAAPSERAPAPSRAAARATPRWMQAATGGALALSLAFGMMLYNTNSNLATMNSTLTQNQQILAQLNQQHTRDAQAIMQMQTQIAQDQQVTMFIAAPQTLMCPLESADRHAYATMYMQPNSTQAVLVVAGMPRPAPGTTYQFWLAKPGMQVPSVTFDVSDDGQMVLQINAPTPINQFEQAMITVEKIGGATQPSDTVMLIGSLSAAVSASVPRTG